MSFVLIIVAWPAARRLLDARVLTRHCHHWSPHRLRHDPHARHKATLQQCKLCTRHKATLQQCKLCTRHKFPVLLVFVCIHAVMAESSGNEMHFNWRGSRFC